MVTPAQLPRWLVREYPFAPQSFTTPHGARMSYLDEGSHHDEAVVMLHGNPTWSFYYRHAIRALAGLHRCIVPDHIGMGLSDKPQDYPYTLETRIKDIEALIASLGLKRVHLIVHDWGGAIGYGFATRHPKLVGRIVTLNTAAFLPKHVPGRIALCKTDFPGTLIVRGANGFAWPATWMSMHRKKLTRAEKRGLLFPYDSWAHRVAVNAFVKDIPTHPRDPSYNTLATIEQNLPRLAAHENCLIWGGADFCFDDRIFSRWTGIFPKAAHHYLKGAGHYVIEDARSEVLDLIQEFLAPVERR